jgi:hypothetical protein
MLGVRLRVCECGDGDFRGNDPQHGPGDNSLGNIPHRGIIPGADNSRSQGPRGLYPKNYFPSNLLLWFHPDVASEAIVIIFTL